MATVTSLSSTGFGLDLVTPGRTFIWLLDHCGLLPDWFLNLDPAEHRHSEIAVGPAATLLYDRRGQLEPVSVPTAFPC